MNKDANLDTSKKIQCVWALVSESSSIDQHRETVSLFNIIDQISIPKEKFQSDEPQQLSLQHEVTVLWRRISDVLTEENSHVDAKITLVDPDGKELSGTTFSFEILQGVRRHRHRSRVPGLIITKSGDYVYRVAYKLSQADNFRNEKEIPIEIRKVSNTTSK